MNVKEGQSGRLRTEGRPLQLRALRQRLFPADARPLTVQSEAIPGRLPPVRGCRPVFLLAGGKLKGNG